MIQFKTSYENICKMYDNIIDYKLNGWKKIDDIEFIKNCENNKIFINSQ